MPRKHVSSRLSARPLLSSRQLPALDTSFMHDRNFYSNTETSYKSSFSVEKLTPFVPRAASIFCRKLATFHYIRSPPFGFFDIPGMDPSILHLKKGNWCRIVVLGVLGTVASAVFVGIKAPPRSIEGDRLHIYADLCIVPPLSTSLIMPHRDLRLRVPLLPFTCSPASDTACASFSAMLLNRASIKS